MKQVNEPLLCSQGGIPCNKAHLEARDAEIDRLRANLATFGKDTEATENRIIDAEFAAQELRTVLKGYACAGRPTCATPRTLDGQCVYALLGKNGSQCGEAAKAALEQIAVLQEMSGEHAKR